jgi:glutamate synthase domain-containing protein 3
MTNGTVVILGETSFNIGAGMTGGEVFVSKRNERFINSEYVVPAPMNDEARGRLKEILEDYLSTTSSRTAQALLNGWAEGCNEILWLVPKKVAAQMNVDVQAASGAAA